MSAKFDTNETAPSVDNWLKEAKKDLMAEDTGMYLLHNGVVRISPKEYVREGKGIKTSVKGLVFSYNRDRVMDAVTETERFKGITHIRLWLNKGSLKVGDDIMYVLVGGDIRPNVIEALTYLVGRIKNECVTEIEEMLNIE